MSLVYETDECMLKDGLYVWKCHVHTPTVVGSNRERARLETGGPERRGVDELCH